MSSAEVELAKARWAVRRAVMDVVAWDQHDWEGASDSAHADYLDDQLDKALEEYVEAYLMEQTGETMEEFNDSFKPQKEYPYADALDVFFNRRAD